MPTISVKLVGGDEVIIITGKQYVYSATLRKFDGYWDSYSATPKSDMFKRWRADRFSRTFENFLCSYFSKGQEVAMVVQELGTNGDQLKRLQSAAERG